MEKREMAGDYEILQAVRLGGKEGYCLVTIPKTAVRLI